jgi:hypothetical protein
MSVSRLRPVSRVVVWTLSLALGAALAVVLVSCGSRDTKGLLPGDTASEIVANLDQVKQDAAEGSCTTAAEEVATIQDQIDSLPSSVDSRLRTRLQEGAQRLADVVNSAGACEAATTSTTTTTSTTESSTESTTTKPKTKSTTTTSTSTSTTSPTTPTTTPTPTATTTSTTTTGPPTGGAVPPGQRENGPGPSGGGD